MKRSHRLREEMAASEALEDELSEARRTAKRESLDDDQVRSPPPVLTRQCLTLEGLDDDQVRMTSLDSDRILARMSALPCIVVPAPAGAVRRTI